MRFPCRRPRRHRESRRPMIVVYADCETGGVLPQHPTIELGAIALSGDVEIASFSQEIKFNESDCDPEALKMNHYDPARWAANAVEPTICAAKLAAWLKPHQAVTLKSKRTGNDYT